MPTIEISKRDLCSLIGKNLKTEEIAELLHAAKATIEAESGDTLRLEVGDANRPDLWCVEGIARAVREYLGRETGMPKYKLFYDSSFVLKNKGVRARPFIAAAVVKNLRFNDESIKQIVQLQEKLCENFGLKRKEAALGIYDFDRIKWPIYYINTKPDTIKFVPLGMGEALTPAQILQRHEKGVQYAPLLAGAKEYPLLIDSAKQVLSMPPVINSDFTGKVTEKTKNVFIEVTGFDHRFILPVLNVMVSALAERKGRIFAVRIFGQGKMLTPALMPKSAKISVEYCNKILGTNFKEKEIVRLLNRAGYDSRTLSNCIEAKYLNYRQDIMDERDVVEDIAITYGYNNLKPEEARIATIGKPAVFVKTRQKIAELLTGQRMQEVATFTLTNKDTLFNNMNLQEQEVIELSNPISSNYSCLRNSLLPTILEFLSQNTKKEFPQRIFEIGECFNVKEQKTKNNLVVAITHKETNFTEIKQILNYIMENLCLKYKISEANHDSFIEGRAGRVLINNTIAGSIGEVNPKVLSSLNIEMPVAVLELDLDILK